MIVHGGELTCRMMLFLQGWHEGCISLDHLHHPDHPIIKTWSTYLKWCLSTECKLFEKHLIFVRNFLWNDPYDNKGKVSLGVETLN